MDRAAARAKKAVLSLATFARSPVAPRERCQPLSFIYCVFILASVLFAARSWSAVYDIDTRWLLQRPRVRATKEGSEAVLLLQVGMGSKGNWGSSSHCRRCKCAWGSKLAGSLDKGSTRGVGQSASSLEGAFGTDFHDQARQTGTYDGLAKSYADVVKTVSAKRLETKPMPLRIRDLESRITYKKGVVERVGAKQRAANEALEAVKNAASEAK